MERRENKFPYTAFGDSDRGFRPWKPETGYYKLTVGALADVDTNTGGSATINFRIIDRPVVTAETTLASSLELSLYPNPAASYVSTKIKTFKPYSLIIYNPFGKAVYRKNGVGSTEETIDLQQQPRGLYTIVTEADGQRQTHRLFLQ